MFRDFETRKLIIFSIFLMCVLNHSTYGQSDFSFSLGGGAMYYNGDLSDSEILPPAEIIKPYYSLDISMLVVDRVDLSLRYLHGQVTGDDALSKERDNLGRNQSFYSNIDEVNLMLRYRLFGVRKDRFLNPFIMFGAGYFWFNPKAELDGVEYELQPLGTEGQFISEGDYPAPYRLSSASVAFGLGLFIRLNDNFAVRIEGAPQLTFTDYLDDTSGYYPDSTALAATPNGATAVLLSSRRPKGFPIGGRPRGNPGKDDVVITVGLSVVYTPGKKNSGTGPPPGVYRKVFKGKQGWWGSTAK